jgi:hypothetical protein
LTTEKGFCRYFVIANAIVTVYGFLVLFHPPGSPLWRLVLALDLVIMQHTEPYIKH